MKLNLKQISADYTITAFDDNVYIDASANTVNVTMLTAAIIPEEIFHFKIDPTSTFAVTITGAGAELVGGSNVLTITGLATNGVLSIQSDGTEWKIIDSSLTLDLGNYLYVSANGNNATAEKGDIAKPWRDPWAAKAVAVSGDLIYVFSGMYTSGGIGTGADVEDDGTSMEATNLYKDGVSYFFDIGAKIHNYNYDQVTQIGITQPIFWKDGTDTTNCIIRGSGEFSTERGLPDNYYLSSQNNNSNGGLGSVILMNNPNASIDISGALMYGADLGLSVLQGDNITYDFKVTKQGWREPFLAEGQVKLSINSDIVDATTHNPTMLVNQMDPLDTNLMKPITNFRPTGADINVNLGVVVQETGRSGGLTNMGGSSVFDETKQSINVGVLKIVDFMTVHFPNPRAFSILDFNGVQPVAGQTVTIGSKTYTWVNTVTATPNEVLIGATVDLSRGNLDTAINKVRNDGVGYSSTTAYHPDVVARTYQLPTGEVHLWHRFGGTAGNSIATSTTMPSATFSAGATLAGGSNSGLNTIELEGYAMGPGVFYMTTAGTCQDAQININIDVADCAGPVLLFYAKNNRNLKANIDINNCVSRGAEPALKFESNGTGAALSGARININANIIATQAPVIYKTATPANINSELSLVFSGRFETLGATEPVILNEGTQASKNDMILKNALLVTPHTESITNTLAQSYRIIGAYANKPADVNSTESVELLTINTNII